jgi:hypothetical protein
MLRQLLSITTAFILFHSATSLAAPDVIRSAQSGRWSEIKTWEGGKCPTAAVKVLIRAGHTVTYDVQSEAIIRSIHIGGTLTFATDKDTRLNVGLLKIQPGESTAEEGFDCDAHAENDGKMPQPALCVGTPEKPVEAGHTALIQLHFVEGMNKESCPAIVCCGGRMEFHGSSLSRTWLKLGDTAKKGSKEVTLSEPVTGWRIGDHLIVTGTQNPDYRRGEFSTEDRRIAALEGTKLVLDKALEFDHRGVGEFRGEVANLSRNVIVESADPNGIRGHTMYHKYSTGSISYAEFRHLGKKNALGKYALHFHLAGNTMRGSSVLGASIWDSQNRWLTIHGTNYLIVRDCVGFGSIGHGFFLEDGTEVYNVLDRNLAVQANKGKPLPKQVLPFDGNEGSGFWWANSLNTFTRNVTCENHVYGYRFEAIKGSSFNPVLPVMQPDGSKKPTDIRTLPFVRFDDNEAHCDRVYGLNLGEGVDRVGPDEKHPFIIRNFKVWELHYAFRPQAPCVFTENMKMDHVTYGVYHPNYDRHVYRNLTITSADAEPFNRGHDDFSVQYGPLAVDGLTFSGHHGNSSMPLIQISDDNPTGEAVTHMRNVKVIDNKGGEKRALINLGGGPRPQPKTPKGVPIYLHDWYGLGEHAKVVSTRAKDLINDGGDYHAEVGLTGDESRVARVKGVEFPKLLDPVDDLPPATVITSIRKVDGKLLVRGATSDNGTVKRVLVNGKEAKALSPNFVDWEAIVDEAALVKAGAEDDKGNIEKLAHEVPVGK